jgi:sialic acid synthase SpsE
MPLIMSTGYCDESQIAAAVSACRRAGNRKLILLQCVSEYPAAPARVNLRAMTALGKRFDCPVGLSDHTMGAVAAIAAAALGACVLEKHFTLDRRGSGPDHAFATEPAEFAAMVRGVREAEAMLGDGVKRPTPHEVRIARSFQLRLIASRPLEKGTKVKPSDYLLRRASFGITPEEAGRALKRPMRKAVAAGRPLTKADF